MAIELNCRDLGVADCDWTARGETPADVVQQAVEHLEERHDMEMPDPEIILEGRSPEEPLQPGVDEAVRIVVKRMWDELEITPQDAPPGAEPAIAKVTTR